MNTTERNTEQPPAQKPDVKRVIVDGQLLKAIKSEIEKSSATEVAKDVLLTLMWAIDQREETEEDRHAFNAIGMIYTLLDEGRIQEVNEAFFERFPEYFNIVD